MLLWLVHGTLQFQSSRVELRALSRSFRMLVEERPKLGPKLGPRQISGILEIWNLEIWEFGIPKIQKIKIIKIQILSAQSVGKVWISRKQILLAPSGAIPGNFSMGRTNQTNVQKNVYFPWRANGPYSPHCSTLGYKSII